MKMRSTNRAALGICVATALLIGCIAQSPIQPAIGVSRPFRIAMPPGKATSGIYVSVSNGTIEGFSSTGKALLCTIHLTVNALDDVAADPNGNLIVPLGQAYSSGSVDVYRGPSMCGTQVGSFSDPYGYPINAVSMNALTGTIAVANEFRVGGSTGGNVAICTLKGGCTQELTGPNIIGAVAGIAMAKNGDCWLSSTKWYSAVTRNFYYDSAQLTYWKRCRGVGQAVTGYQNEAYGSISIDSHGNLVSLDEGNYYSRHSQLWVYKGCDPKCTLVGGPFHLRGQYDTFGALNDKNDEYGIAETQHPVVDIYKYNPTSVTYMHSFSDSLPIHEVAGFAFSPSAKP